MAFVVHTYAAPTDYVPEWLGNRDSWRKGGEFFSCKILPLNDSEFHLVHKGAIEAEKDGGQYYDFLRVRVPEISGLEIASNDGAVIPIKSGTDLLSYGRKYLDATTFSVLIGELTTAIMKQSVLAQGELKVSSSLSAS